MENDVERSNTRTNGSNGRASMISRISIYNPYDNRTHENTITDLETLMHFLRFGFGSAILSMPLFFKNLGLIFGLCNFLVMAIFCGHGVYMVVKCSHILERRVRNSTIGLADLGRVSMSFSPDSLIPYASWFGSYINCLLVINMFMVSCISYVFVANNIFKFVNVYTDHNIDIRLYIVCLSIPSLIANSMSSLKCLSPFTIFANLCYALALIFIFRFIFQSLPPISDRPYIGKIEHFMPALTSSLYTLSVIVIALPLENTMKYPKHFIGWPGIFYYGFAVIITIDSMVGFFGYMKYGDSSRQSITLNLPDDDYLAQSVKILMSIALFVSHILVMHVPLQITKKILMNRFPDHPKIIFHIVPLIMIILLLLVTIAIPNLMPLMSLVGSICSSNLSLICPAIIETFTYYQISYGLWRWRLIKNSIIILIGIIFMFFGTYSSMSLIVRHLFLNSS